jgi:photosystem II stability/assembly factor-like uncharacterized protein
LDLIFGAIMWQQNHSKFENMIKAFLIFSAALFATISFEQPTSWQNKGIGGGGALFAPSISPNNAAEIYLQCDMTEVFHTTNSGTNWSQVHYKELISTGGQHTVEFTSDPNILYTVNLDFLTDERFPVKSVDGGDTWSPLAADPTGADAWFISADPNSTNRILISSYTELFISTNGGTSFQSAYDLGSDFLISGVFWKGDSIFVGTNIGLLVSSDGGANFNVDASSGIPAGEGFISFTGANDGATTRLMGTTANQGDLYPGVNALDIGVYSSTIRMDYGVTNWTNATTGFDVDHDFFIIASSLYDVTTFYIGGTDNNTSYPVIYKTTDGGANWNEVFLTTNNQNIITGYSGYGGDEDWYYGEIVFGLDVAPNDVNTVIFTDFGFAHITSNGGTSWKQAYVATADQNPAGSATPEDLSYGSNGLENTSCWNIHWKDQNNLFASYTDITATRSTDAGDSWAFDYAGISYNTVYHVVEHPTSGRLYAAVSSVHDLYQSTYLTDAQINGGTGAILYSDDNGVTWQMLHNFSHPVIWLAIDPNDETTMYASVVHSTAGGIFRTDNLETGAASVWTNTTAPPRTEGHPYNVFVLEDGTVVSTWCGRRAPGFTTSSGVFTSNDQGASWTDVSMNDDMYYWTKDITIDPNDAAQNTWYVSVFSGWGGAANDKGGLYKTTDRGLTWTLFVDLYRVESATVNPQDADEIYISTENEGLWYTNNATATTPTFVQLDEYVFQHPMRIFYDPFNNENVWVTSFGNGIKMGSTAPNTSGFSDIENASLSIFPNPSNGEITLTSTVEMKSVQVYDLSNRLLFSSALSDQNKVEIDLEFLPAGIYFVQVTDKQGSLSTLSW